MNIKQHHHHSVISNNNNNSSTTTTTTTTATTKEWPAVLSSNNSNNTHASSSSGGSASVANSTTNSSSSNTTRYPVVCKYYKSGTCKLGDSCRFSHTPTTSSPNNLPQSPSLLPNPILHPPQFSLQQQQQQSNSLPLHPPIPSSSSSSSSSFNNNNNNNSNNNVKSNLINNNNDSSSNSIGGDNSKHSKKIDLNNSNSNSNSNTVPAPLPFPQPTSLPNPLISSSSSSLQSPGLIALSQQQLQQSLTSLPLNSLTLDDSEEFISYHCRSNPSRMAGRRPFLQLVVLYASDARVLRFAKEVQNQFLEGGIDVFLKTEENSQSIKTENLAEIITNSKADCLVVLGDRNLKNKSCQAKRRGKLVEMEIEEVITSIWSEWNQLLPKEEEDLTYEQVFNLLEKHCKLRHVKDRLTKLRNNISEFKDIKLPQRNARNSDTANHSFLDEKIASKLTTAQKSVIRFHQQVVEAIQYIEEMPFVTQSDKLSSSRGSSVGPDVLAQNEQKPVISESNREKLLFQLNKILPKIEGMADTLSEYGAPLSDAYFDEYNSNVTAKANESNNSANGGSGGAGGDPDEFVDLKPGQWRCNLCTFINDNVPNCSMCETPYTAPNGNNDNEWSVPGKKSKKLSIQTSYQKDSSSEDLPASQVLPSTPSKKEPTTTNASEKKKNENKLSIQSDNQQQVIQQQQQQTNQQQQQQQQKISLNNSAQSISISNVIPPSTTPSPPLQQQQQQQPQLQQQSISSSSSAVHFSSAHLNLPTAVVNGTTAPSSSSPPPYTQISQNINNINNPFAQLLSNSLTNQPVNILQLPTQPLQSIPIQQIPQPTQPIQPEHYEEEYPSLNQVSKSKSKLKQPSNTPNTNSANTSSQLNVSPPSTTPSSPILTTSPTKSKISQPTTTTPTPTPIPVTPITLQQQTISKLAGLSNITPIQNNNNNNNPISQLNNNSQQINSIQQQQQQQQQQQEQNNISQQYQYYNMFSQPGFVNTSSYLDQSTPVTSNLLNSNTFSQDPIFGWSSAFSANGNSYLSPAVSQENTNTNNNISSISSLFTPDNTLFRQSSPTNDYYQGLYSPYNNNNNTSQFTSSFKPFQTSMQPTSYYPQQQQQQKNQPSSSLNFQNPQLTTPQQLHLLQQQQIQQQQLQQQQTAEQFEKDKQKARESVIEKYKFSHPPQRPCCYCGEESILECYNCAKTGYATYFCTKEHQSLMWKEHSRYHNNIMLKYNTNK
ncbi:hypothetical protein PPL_11327 [Heterostelium album PN500]|uniref:C3H1-type domain-containing protein n=1 Tax=Heterostelium pallidum (strain ATCC 26659 / Pp 5 / PN500) TaxID=670386 RepID=D3BT35_HETP5|nr:hypothetical protein PPL_11327 [Heterostelium album PN500]EFA75252.1 hypothetical protein PPL_11327 [Heterostelium album PN500]|eukprot:XP_020427386.1 hypothetical protein PPL_11327 [Heterostelium album PN500]